MADVYRVRRLLEPAVLREFPTFGGAAARVPALGAAVSEGRAAADRDDWDGVASANQHFHRAVVALAGSPRLDATMELLLAEMRLFFHQMDGAEEFHRPYLEENARIAEHVAAGRAAEAAEQMASYLSAAERQLVTAFGASPVA
ncbi:FCD domain-containing protein [Nocardioides mesophilus]|uniref:FCD domain-containing protein n=1 Tax=Nocardioides mesophilus TaxID=433659 RepID=UPI001CB6DE0F|nr:FCD domain-containing protein [Nocardioides mesophilus]